MNLLEGRKSSKFRTDFEHETFEKLNFERQFRIESEIVV